MMQSEFLWTQKYRPKTIEDCILPQNLKDTFSEFVKQGAIPNLLLCGTQGTGKTTVAYALCNELNLDYITINGSMSGGIDTLRNDIKQFASTNSFSGGRKMVILDEADYLQAQSTQPALRNFMEEFSKNCGFILTCNFKNRIIEALHSRCSVIEFKIPAAEKPMMAKNFYKRICHILKEEDIEFEQKVVAELIMRYFPDWRRVINELQRYSVTGKIDTGILSAIKDEVLDELIGHLKDKNFSAMRKWVAENTDTDSSVLFRRIYDNSTKYLKPSSIPQLVLYIADYSYKSAFCADQEINMVAFLTNCMVELDFV